ncbi:hypothetical protein EVAR_36614_1 [Eumeta japonica]|uniref:Uncharacterized protein n=1 Tax=Eumeta variegata TaxID=151549 RepID=A0A4C1ZQ32_EUMVA|nr:hypothetical protein EVAR_36614_1 [Eumeta japonica]
MVERGRALEARSGAAFDSVYSNKSVLRSAKRPLSAGSESVCLMSRSREFELLPLWERPHYRRPARFPPDALTPLASPPSSRIEITEGFKTNHETVTINFDVDKTYDRPQVPPRYPITRRPLCVLTDPPDALTAEGEWPTEDLAPVYTNDPDGIRFSRTSYADVVPIRNNPHGKSRTVGTTACCLTAYGEAITEFQLAA